KNGGSIEREGSGRRKNEPIVVRSKELATDAYGHGTMRGLSGDRDDNDHEAGTSVVSAGWVVCVRRNGRRSTGAVVYAMHARTAFRSRKRREPESCDVSLQRTERKQAAGFEKGNPAILPGVHRGRRTR